MSTLTLNDALAASGVTAEALADLEPYLEDADARAAFVELASQGPHPARALIREPTWIAAIANDATTTRGVEDVFALLRDDEDADLYRALRRVKRRESLRIFLRELRGTSTRTTAGEFAALAEGCLRFAVRRLARDELAELEAKFCVLGMGKLGGHELNPGSDVDLIFLCDDVATSDDDFRKRAVQFAQAIVDSFAATTADGFVFRVDLRLRPDGTQGPIVLPVTASRDYYLQYGRTWERSAMIKARAVAGNLEMGSDFLRGIEPWIYRRSLDYGVIDELRAMKESIEANAEIERVVGVAPSDAEPTDTSRAPLADALRLSLRGRAPKRRRPAPAAPTHLTADKDESGVLGWDLKIGVGGIREIEFFVQALQLVHCGQRPKLRAQNTLQALDALLWAGFITSQDHAMLTDAYDLFRRLEHQVQMAEDLQTHVVARNWDDFDRSARALGLDRAQLSARLIAARHGVREIFGRLFEPTGRAAELPTVDPAQSATIALMATAPVQQLRSDAFFAAVKAAGFGRPRQVCGQLEVLRAKSWGPFRASGNSRDLRLARAIAADAAAAPDPDMAFSAFTRFAVGVGDRPGIWDMLADNPHATRLLLQVFGSAGELSRDLIADPHVFTRLLAVGSVAVEKTADRLRDELATRLLRGNDPEHRMGIIRRFHREETLRIGLHETGGAASIEQTLGQLSMLAELVVRTALTQVYEPLRTHKRSTTLPPLNEIPFAVVAMGKLGGRELGFGSDLDVVFVYEEERQYRLEHTFYARLAQRLVRALTTLGNEGRLYEVDTRLRPSGNRGALVVSADAFDQYYRENAQLWERQALIRARPFIGPPALLTRIDDVRRRHAFRQDDDDLAQAVRDMRDRLSGAHYEHGTTDIKFGPGGIIDIEFATQAEQMASASAGSDSPDPTVVQAGLASQSTTQALRALGEEDAAQDYLWLNRVLARLRMSAAAATSVIPGDEDGRRRIARRMGHQGSSAAAAFDEELRDVLSRCQSFYARVFAV